MEDDKNIIIPFSGTPDKMIPKFCTDIGFTVIQDEQGNRQVIMTLSYAETGEKNRILIERVAITTHHANSLSETLNKMLYKINQKEK